MELCDGAIILACSLLRPGGSLVMKFFTGKEDQLLTKRMNFMFEKTYRMKPDACRLESREMYIVGRRFRREFTPTEVFSVGEVV
ncbi:2' O-ribose methyltransferase [Scheffersomyces spartinae]|uniref:rRNA methyltransferase 2, mitochondrial n=1 Tax=Scheffersomyces spartinae TaxID=45513 RepID=A0A9P7VB72_9ASCO|nr:2' O-ribose methyltransferase [Scheffersomyces spartinae]KAG7194583.1 2' O-ribose methyltransferase [Scheffersomyces spartinae]